MTDPLYSDDYLRNQAKVEEQIRLRSANIINIDADKAQRVLRLKGQTGLPEQLIYDNLDDIEEKARIGQFNPAKYKETAPAWQKFASENPFNLAVLKEDEKNLTWIERAWRPISLASEQSWAEQEVGMLGVKRRAQGGELDESDQSRLAELKKYTVDHDFNANMVQKPLVWLTKQSANMIGGWKKGVERATVLAPAGLVLGGYTGTAVFPVVGTAAGMMTGWSAGMTAGFIEGGFEHSRDIEGGHAYNEFRELGFTHDDAAWASHLTGNINGLMEAASGSLILSKLPGMPTLRGAGSRIAKDILIRPTVRAAIGKGVKEYGVQMVSEVGTEIAQESTNMVLGEILKIKNDRTDFLTRDQVVERIGDIATETFKSMFLLAGVGPGVRMVQDSRRANDANLRALAFESMGDAAKGSKLRKNLPSKYQEFVDLVTKDGPVQNILVAADGFDTYWQSQSENPNEIAESLGVKNMEEARLYGGDIEIPVKEFADKIAPNKHLQGLTPHLRTNENQMTQAEAQEWEKIKPQLAEDMEKSLKNDHGLEPNKEIAEDVTGQLIAAGTEKKPAKVQGRIFAAMMSTTAAESNKDPMALYNERFRGVMKDIPESLQGQDVNVEVDHLLDRIRAKDFPQQREIFGNSLFDMIRGAGGIQDQGGELSNRDVKKQERGLVSDTGLTIDGIAELAHDQGYIPEYDSALLLEAFDKELGGELQFGTNHKVDAELQELLGQLEVAAQFLEDEHIDLDNMTNAEVRKYLDGVKTLEQSDNNEINDWSDFVLFIATQSESLETPGDARQQYDKVNTMLARAAATAPRVADKQDFGDVMITERRVDKKGATLTTEVKAQVLYEDAVKERNVLKRLLDCVNG